jgi:hypothetical protein
MIKQKLLSSVSVTALVLALEVDFMKWKPVVFVKDS